MQRFAVFVSVFFLLFCNVFADQNSPSLKGDMNSDGVIDKTDYELIIKAALDPDGYCVENNINMAALLVLADMNNNGVIDLRDVSLLRDMNRDNSNTESENRNPFLTNGKNCFPIGVWAQSPMFLKRYRDIGINMYVALYSGPTERQLQQFDEAGMLLITFQNEASLKHLNSNVIYGWMFSDEPDNMQKGEDRKLLPVIPPEKVSFTLREYKKKDPSRPVFLNLGQGVAWDKWHGRGNRTNHPEDYAEYYREADIACFNFYPFANSRDEVYGQVWRIGYAAQRVIKWTGGSKRVWFCVETGPIWTEKKPTTSQIRSDVWMGIIHGARGIIYFAHIFYPKYCSYGILKDPDVELAIKKINMTLLKLAPVINNIDIKQKVLRASCNPKNAEVHYVQTVYADNLYIFAIPYDDSASVACFDVSNIVKTSNVEVLEENRNIPLVNGSFKDSFRSWGAHLYKIPLKNSGR